MSALFTIGGRPLTPQPYTTFTQRPWRFLTLLPLISVALILVSPSGVAGDVTCSPIAGNELPPGLGGPASARVDLQQAESWRAYRTARETERMLEALDPEAVRASYRRIQQNEIDNGCISLDQLVDMGRALFLRQFTPAEGLGNGLAGKHAAAGSRDAPNLRRLGAGTLGGPAALSCASCHWRGGIGGAGDRADNSYLGGDGVTVSSHEVLHPPALWGSGWVEIIAAEMTRDLQRQQSELLKRAETSSEPVHVSLQSKSIDFGELVASPGVNGQSVDQSVVLNSDGVQGIDQDLVVRPFGWRGRYRTLRQAIVGQFHLHLGLQSNELLDSKKRAPELQWIDRGRLSRWHRRDPDSDGVRNEIIAGQVTAISAFLATLDTPQTRIPTQGPQRGEFMTAELTLAPTAELLHRWGDGARTFERIGCASCHVPYLEVDSAEFDLSDDLSPVGGITIDIAEQGATPQPMELEGRFAVPVFSDFKRHRMGAHLAQRNAATGVQNDDLYLTRPLWGFASSQPYMHDGSATTLDQAVALHGGNGSEAQASALAYAALTDNQKNAVRVYLMSLQRAESIRIR